MNLFLLSCTDNLNNNLKESLKKEISKRGNRIAYISSEPQNTESGRPYYLSTIEDYKVINNDTLIDYFDLSDNFSDEELNKLLDYKIIYLSGGNTYVFLNDAKKRNLYNTLKSFLENDGLLIGASAGSIMMTPSIDLASIEDENTPDLKDTTGFNFVDFEFHPHLCENDREFLSKYSENKEVKIYLCKDGDGIFYNNGNIKLFGSVIEFSKN